MNVTRTDRGNEKALENDNDGSSDGLVELHFIFSRHKLGTQFD